MMQDEQDEGEECPSCHGSGVYDVGDPEDGILATCLECDGIGFIYDEE